jgi:hypothetical protein
LTQNSSFTRIGGITEESELIQWFWDIIKNDLNREQRQGLYKAVVGSRIVSVCGDSGVHMIIIVT